MTNCPTLSNGTQYGVVGVCDGPNCSRRYAPQCGRKNFILQCAPVNSSPCTYVYLAQHDELICGDGWLGALCSAYPQYGGVNRCPFSFERANNLGVGCCWSEAKKHSQ